MRRVRRRIEMLLAVADHPRQWRIYVGAGDAVPPTYWPSPLLFFFGVFSIIRNHSR
jgi:hypothetical protein